MRRKAATRRASRDCCQNCRRRWTTVSVDRNIISASANALVDGLQFGIIEHEDFCHLCDVEYDGFEVVPTPSMPRNVTMSR